MVFEPTPSVEIAMHVDHVGEIADRQLDRAERARRRPGRGDAAGQARQTLVGRVGVDAGVAVIVARRGHVCCLRHASLAGL